MRLYIWRVAQSLRERDGGRPFTLLEGSAHRAARRDPVPSSAHARPGNDCAGGGWRYCTRLIMSREVIFVVR